MSEPVAVADQLPALITLKEKGDKIIDKISEQFGLYKLDQQHIHHNITISLKPMEWFELVMLLRANGAIIGALDRMTEKKL